MSIILKFSHFRFIVSPFTTIRNSSTYNPNLYRLLKTMPKDPKHIVEAQKQRIKIKQKAARYAPGRVTLQIVGTGAKGAPRAVYLFSDQSR